jgi:hypothetical protein
MKAAEKAAHTQAWVFIRSESRLWTVGFYDPSGKWHSESDHESPESAAARVAALNGEVNEELLSALEALSQMYVHAWDEVGGGLVMMPESVAKFEEAHAKAAAAIQRARGEQ